MNRTTSSNDAALWPRLLRLGASLLVVAAPACGDGGDEAPAPPSPGDKVCSAIEETFQACGQSLTPCASALVSDCAELVDTLSEPFLESVAGCMSGEGAPTTCLVSSLGDLAPSEAHRELARSFCASCAFGIPGCEDVFFSDDGSDYALGAVILPLGDEVVTAITDRCTAGPTCLASFVSCAQSVLVERALPVETAQCLIDGLVSGADVFAVPQCESASTSSDGSGGNGSGGGGAGGQGGSGSGTTTGTSGSTSSGNVCDFGLTNTCGQAETLATIAGDAGFDKIVLEGTVGRWFQIYVDETSSLPHSVEYTVTLENAPGMNFDLVVYPGGPDAADCTSAQILGADAPEAVTVSADDSPSDEGRWISILVLHNWGTGCDEDDAWKLTVQGNFAYQCQTDGTCTTDDDCICADCTTDSYCSNPEVCEDDGVCDPYNEGCVCSDCVAVPQCQ